MYMCLYMYKMSCVVHMYTCTCTCTCNLGMLSGMGRTKPTRVIIGTSHCPQPTCVSAIVAAVVTIRIYMYMYM